MLTAFSAFPFLPFWYLLCWAAKETGIKGFLTAKDIVFR